MYKKYQMKFRIFEIILILISWLFLFPINSEEFFDFQFELILTLMIYFLPFALLVRAFLHYLMGKPYFEIDGVHLHYVSLFSKKSFKLSRLTIDVRTIAFQQFLYIADDNEKMQLYLSEVTALNFNVFYTDIQILLAQINGK